MPEVSASEKVMVIVPDQPIYDRPSTWNWLIEFLNERFPLVKFQITRDSPFRAPHDFLLLTTIEVSGADREEAMKIPHSIPDEVLISIMDALKGFDPKPRLLH